LDISKIDLNFVEIFSENYEFSCDVFSEKDPAIASPRKQKKIRKWINDLCSEEGEFPASVMKYISKDVSNADYFAFMKACYDKVAAEGSWSRQKFDRFSEGFDDCVKHALWELVNYQGYVMSEDITVRGNDVVIDLYYNWSIERKLILKDAKGLPEDCSTLSFQSSSFVKNDNGYSLVGEAFHYNIEDKSFVVIRFSGAEVETNVFNSTNFPFIFVSSPWNYISKVTECILEKASLPECTLNDSEKNLLPLLNDIGMLKFLSYAKKVSEKPTFGEVKKYIEKYGYKKILTLVDQLSENYFDGNKQFRISEKLRRELDKAEYEPLWREIYNMISASQSEYPTRSDEYIDREILESTRSTIQERLHKKGYNGEYPLFYKRNALKGIHIAESHGQTYFVGMEKNAKFIIQCNELASEESFQVEFLCGTALNRKNNAPEDVFSCMFDACGKRFYRRAAYCDKYIDSNGNETSDDLVQSVDIAVKKAEWKKLTRKERDMHQAYAPFTLSDFLRIFLIMGGFFAFCMTLVGVISCVVLCILDGNASMIGGLLSEIPWILLFLIAWIGFGGGMSIVSLIGARNR